MIFTAVEFLRRAPRGKYDAIIVDSSDPVGMFVLHLIWNLYNSFITRHFSILFNMKTREKVQRFSTEWS